MIAAVFSERHDQKGQKTGLRQSIEQGETRTLKRQLARKFGPVSPSQLAMIEHANSDQFEVWLDHGLEAQSPAEAFDRN